MPDGWLPDAATISEAGRLVLLVVGTVLALFGLGIYHGALRLFGGLTGGIAGLMFYFSNKAMFPELSGIGQLVFPLVCALVGGWLGSWLAAVAHVVIFFLVGCLTGFLMFHTFLGHLSPASFTPQTWPGELPQLGALHWLGILVVGLVYVGAANWMIAITTAILGALMVASGFDNRLVLYSGAPVGILVQYALFLRREEYRGSRTVIVRERPAQPRVIYDRGNEFDDD